MTILFSGNTGSFDHKVMHGKLLYKDHPSPLTMSPYFRLIYIPSPGVHLEIIYVLSLIELSTNILLFGFQTLIILFGNESQRNNIIVHSTPTCMIAKNTCSVCSEHT